MPKPAHAKPCQNCGHQDLHGEVSGCIAVTSEPSARTTWCDCLEYAPPTARPYAGTSGHSGSSTSRERAERRDASGLTGATQQAVYDLAKREGPQGVTVAEARGVLDQHHGTVSGALSVLHMEGILERLTERRDRCQVYVLPDFTLGRETAPHRSAVPKGPDPADVREAITNAYYDARNDGLTMEAAADAATAAVMALL